MILIVKYVGSGETNFTVNNDYAVVNFEGSGNNAFGWMINDLGNLVKTNQNINNPAEWQLVSVQYGGCVSVYP